MRTTETKGASPLRNRHTGPRDDERYATNALRNRRDPIMTKTNKTLMTAALGGLMLAATISTASAEEKAAGTASGEKMGECHGINACKGTGACHGAGNTCAGTNACKGKGWIKATKADCEAKGGQFKA
jgi:hypothetical protein